jgi:hypothetical protein
MADESPAEPGGVLDRISRNIAVLGSIIAAFVGMNTALTTCSAQTVARHQTFRQAVDSEETYWRNLYNDYLAVFRSGVTDRERTARLFALSVLAERPIPKFDEYSLGMGGSDARATANARLTSMQNRLKEALSRRESSNPEVAQQRQEQSLAAAEQTVRTSRERASADIAGSEEAPAESAQIASGVNYLPQVLARGDPRGWDFDVFWCGGGGTEIELSNYSAGLDMARALSARSAGGERLANDRLGRVRLVMLPESRQGGIYPTRGAGLELRAERIRGEPAIAAAVRSTVPKGRDLRIIASDMPTPWYVSLFSCAAGQAPSGRPRSNSLAPAG